MGMSGAQFGQQYGQAGVQQMGSAGVNAQQVQNKTVLSNNLPQFPAELKGAGSVPNMVSVIQILKKYYLSQSLKDINIKLKYKCYELELALEMDYIL